MYFEYIFTVEINILLKTAINYGLRRTDVMSIIRDIGLNAEDVINVYCNYITNGFCYRWILSLMAIVTWHTYKQVIYGYAEIDTR